MLRIFKLFLLIATVLVDFNDGKVDVQIRITDYSNNENLMHNGGKCETYHWLGDHCDPMFDICVTTENYGCNIMKSFINFKANKRHISFIWQDSITLYTFPSHIRITVKVTDHDRYDAHDHIADFREEVFINRPGFTSRKYMQVIPRGLNVRLFSEVRVTCTKDYYGHDCGKHCVSVPGAYDCDKNTGEKICSMYCGFHKSCHILGTYVRCQCLYGWMGVSCDIKIRYSSRITSTTSVPSINTTFESSTTTEKPVPSTEIVISTSKLKEVTLASTYPPSTTLEDTTYAKSNYQILKTQIKPEYPDTIPQLITPSFNSQSDSDMDSERPINARLKQKEIANTDGVSNHFKLNASQVRILFLLLVMIGMFFVAFLILLFGLRYLKLKYKLKYLNQSQVHRSLPPVIFKSNHNDQDCTLYTMADSEYDTCSIRTNSNDHPTDIKSQNNAIEEDYHLYETPISKNNHM